jgi:high-affinity K+ transport system ATPase subunit B
MLPGPGLHPILLTGDNEATARAVAAAVGIDEVIAGPRPRRLEQPAPQKVPSCAGLRSYW